jgi:hypothetical protein
MMSDRVFIVTSGEYSDYGIESVWTTREAAEQHAGTWGSVEEWLLNTTAERSELFWRAWIDPITGEVRVSDKPTEYAEIPRAEARKNQRSWGFVPPPIGWLAWGYGTTPEHARKSLSDALAKAKAAEAGL